MRNAIPEMWSFPKQGFLKDSWQKQTQKEEEREGLQKCWQKELRTEQNTAPGLHCSGFPGDKTPFIPPGESQLKVSRERKRYEMKRS